MSFYPSLFYSSSFIHFAANVFALLVLFLYNRCLMPGLSNITRMELRLLRILYEVQIEGGRKLLFIPPFYQGFWIL